MIWLIKFLAFGHIHKWKILVDALAYKGGDSKSMPVGRVYILQCEKCGDVKRRNLNG